MEDDHLNHSNRHRKLNFDTPLLSTRRHPTATGVDSVLCHSASQGSSDWAVPFSWEQAPGKPKESFTRTGDVGCHISTPRLKAPPSFSLRPPLHQTREGEGCGEDEGCDGGDDENDVYSLSEAIDIVERAENAHKLDGDLKLKLEEYGRENPSPSFMMERFLPDATALAASALKFSSHGSPGLPIWTSATYSEKSTRAREPCSSPKGCGLQTLLPNWLIKQRLCGVKSPVRQGFVSVQHPCRPK